jgi:hypothetical protein
VNGVTLTNGPSFSAPIVLFDIDFAPASPQPEYGYRGSKRSGGYFPIVKGT